MSKKILFHIMTGNPTGGSDYSLYYLIKNLDKRKYIPIVTFVKECFLEEKMQEEGIMTIVVKKSTLSLPQSAIKVGHKVVKNSYIRKILGYISKTSIEFLKLIMETYRLIKVMRQYHIDLLHLNLSLRLNRDGILAGILTKTPIISHVRGFQKIQKIDLFLSKYIKKVIYVSEAVRTANLVQGVSENQGIVIYNGVDIEAFQSLKSCPHTEFVIGSMGRLIELKGHINLVKAAALILKNYPNVRFVIVGDGPQKDFLFNEIERLGLSNKFEIRGPLIDIRKFLMEIDIFVYPSIAPDACPRAVIEAMAAGKPVISTKQGGIPELIGDAGILVQDDKSPIELSGKIIQLFDKDLIDKLGQKSRVRVKKYFDIVETVSKIEKVYAEILTNLK